MQVEIFNAFVEELVLAVLFVGLRGDLLDVEFQSGYRNPLKIELLEEFLVNFFGVNLVNWNGHFEALIHPELELPALLNQCLLLFLDLPLILYDLGGLGYLLERIVVSAIEEEDACLLQKTEFDGKVVVKVQLLHHVQHLRMILPQL